MFIGVYQVPMNLDPMRKRPFHIIGIGSHHGDDQFGWLAAAYLRNSAAFQQRFGDEVKISVCDSPLDGFLEHAKNSRAVIILDAVLNGGHPGSVMRIEEQALPTIQQPYSSHGFGVAQMVELGRAMDILPEHVVLFGIELESCDAHAPISKEVQSSLEQIEKLVVEEIKNCGSE
jgi:hydrogenase maturation protease